MNVQENKNYIKCKVILVPTINYNAPLIIDSNFQTLHYCDPGISLWGYQHLYIVSDEEIKKGDWCVNFSNLNDPKNNLVCCDTIGSVLNANGFCSWKKIIAATNKSLNLPEISKQFIDNFIFEYNEDNIIRRIFVEYEEIQKGSLLEIPTQDLSQLDNYWGLIPKIDQNNCILIKQNKKTWNKEEVIKLFFKFLDETSTDHKGMRAYLIKQLNNFFNKNL